MQEDFVRASEVGEFCYCKRAWWLHYHHNHDQTEAMKLGVIKHDKLAWKTQLFHRLQMLAYMLVSIGITGIVVYLLLRFYFQIL